MAGKGKGKGKAAGNTVVANFKKNADAAIAKNRAAAAPAKGKRKGGAKKGTRKPTQGGAFRQMGPYKPNTKVTLSDGTTFIATKHGKQPLPKAELVKRRNKLDALIKARS